MFLGVIVVGLSLLFFSIPPASEERWTKEINISVLPPTTFELLQNYPNPFNPTTTISYLLPAASHITLRIYNLLGQEVAALVNAERTAGQQQEIWDAAGQSSGMYVYELIATDLSGQRSVARKAMLLVKSPPPNSKSS